MSGPYLSVAVRAARKASSLIRKYRHLGFQVAEKSSSADKVTTADVEAEKAIAHLLSKRFKHHDILGEEGKYQRKDSPYLWIIDPLDGTNNFTRGIPHYSVSIALAKEGVLIAGCVLDVESGELFTAERGEGAYLNGKRIRVSDHGSFDGALLGTGFFYDRGEPIRHTLRATETFFEKGIMCVRRMGSAALDLCYVAAGRFDGYWEYYLKPWDYAAGALIVEEAGGVCSNDKGEAVGLDGSFIVASNGLMQEKILDVLKKTK